MEPIFTFKNVDYKLQTNASLKIGNLKSVYHVIESLEQKFKTFNLMNIKK